MKAGAGYTNLAVDRLVFPCPPGDTAAWGQHLPQRRGAPVTRGRVLRALLILAAGFLGATLLLSLVFTQGVAAQTLVSGTITQNTTWQGEILVTDHVSVLQGVTLTILPGTRVEFQHYRGYKEPERRLTLSVGGSIIALGTAAEPIYFTSDAADPQNGDWGMLQVASPTGPARFQYCVFEFALQGLNAWQASPEIDHCVFRWHNWEGVYFESYCQPTLTYCQLYENGYNGLAAEQSNTIDMDYCEVWRNGTSGVHIDNSTAEVRRSLIHDNGAHGLSADNASTLRALGDSLYDNKAFGLGVGEGHNIIEVSNLTFHGNGGEIGGSYTTVASPYFPPASVDIGFTPDQSYALGYIPSDPQLDKYMYVYPDDETRRIVRKMGKGLGLTWALAWDGEYIWTSTPWAHIYKLDPESGQVLDDFVLGASPQWGTPLQPWGMTFDDQGDMWVLDFAARKLFKVDPSTRSIVYSFDSPYPDQGGCKGLTWDGTHLCVMGWASPVIYKMTKTGTLAGTINLDRGGGGGLAWDGEYFWCPGGQGIMKYDSSGRQVGWIYAASEGTWDLTWDGHYLWASQRTNENWADEKIFQLEILDDHSQMPSFPDVDPDNPYYDAIAELASRGIILGKGDGNFYPADPVIRQQFAKMIVKTLAIPVDPDDVCPFVDVEAGVGTDPLYPDKYVAVCARRQITKGKDETHFAPYEDISCQQLITMVARAAGLSEAPAGYNPPFLPGQFYPEEHYQNARNAAYAGLLHGLQGLGATYDFYAPASRGECAQLLYNLLARPVVSAGQITNPWWAETGSDPPTWRYDSRVGSPTVQLATGTTLVYRALIRDQTGEVLKNTDVSAAHPKMVSLHTAPGATTPTQSAWDPADFTTDGSGYLYWTNGGAGYWGTASPGDLIGVSFWLDFDDDDVIDEGVETDSNIPGWGTPWAQWEFVVP